jgi:serine/threonine protein kinase
VLKDLLSATDYPAQVNSSHNDIKEENILYNPIKMTTKLIDMDAMIIK